MKLLEQLYVVASRRRLAPNTIDAYSQWVRRFLLFCARLSGYWKHPAQLGTPDVEAFLNDLVLNLRLSASAQNQALCGLVFLYTHALPSAGRLIIHDVFLNDDLGGPLPIAPLLRRPLHPHRRPCLQRRRVP